MIFAFATDEKSLMVFPNEPEAISYCEGIDVEEGNWAFFDGNGNPLDAIFTSPNKHGAFSVVSGTYVLRPSTSSIKHLLSLLEEVATVEGMPPYSSVTQIKKLLSSKEKVIK